jgi:hypothetical protein
LCASDTNTFSKSVVLIARVHTFATACLGAATAFCTSLFTAVAAFAADFTGADLRAALTGADCATAFAGADCATAFSGAAAVIAMYAIL